MEDKKVDLNTAILAKQKGFDCDCDYYYVDGGFSYAYESDNYNNAGERFISAPTQSLLQRWLRENHNLHVTCYRMNNQWNGQVFHIARNCYVSQHLPNDTFEIAFERGLVEALKMIEDEK